MNPDGSACLYLEEALTYELPTPIETFTEFLEGPVRNYFICQSLVARGDPWPFGEHEHGAKGVLAAYAKLLGTSDPNQIRSFLECLRHRPTKGHKACPCGSGKKVRDCHQSQLDELGDIIRPEIAARALRQLDRG
jgi:hypothetical protein